MCACVCVDVRAYMWVGVCGVLCGIVSRVRQAWNDVYKRGGVDAYHMRKCASASEHHASSF